MALLGMLPNARPPPQQQRQAPRCENVCPLPNLRAVEDEQCTVHACHEEDCREEHHDAIQLATHTRTIPS